MTVALLMGAPFLPVFAQDWTDNTQTYWERPAVSAFPSDPNGSCFCDPNPCLVGEFSLDLLVMTRSSADSQNVLFVNDTSHPVLNVKDVGFDAQTGLRVNAVLPSECGCDLLFRYFGLHDMAESGLRDDVGVFYVAYNRSPTTAASAYFVNYESHLDDAELNVRTRQWRRVAPMVGMRITQLEEVFNIVDSANQASGVFSDVENEMYGVQFGAEVLLCEGGRSRLESTVKACVYFNDLALTARATDVTGSPIELDRDFSHTAFGGEAQLVWVYQFCHNFSLRLGYEALWLEGVGLAPDQSNNFRIVTNEGSLDVGSAFYQGGYVGFDLMW